MRSGATRATWRCCCRWHVQMPPYRRVDLEEQEVELGNFGRSVWLDHSRPRSLVVAVFSPRFFPVSIKHANVTRDFGALPQFHGRGKAAHVELVEGRKFLRSQRRLN